MVSDIEREFGADVAKLVDYVTEKNHDLLSWDERKREAIAHIQNMSHDALLLKSADILYNLRDLIADLEEVGEEVWKHFNAPREKQITHYTKLVEALKVAWPENPLLGEIRSVRAKIGIKQI